MKDSEGIFKSIASIKDYTSVKRVFYYAQMIIVNNIGLCFAEVYYSLLLLLYFSTRPDRPWGLPSLMYNGYRIIPEGKAAGAWRWPPIPI
jgi:hypothetical protein